MKKVMAVWSLAIGLLMVSCTFLVGPDTPVGKGNLTILPGGGAGAVRAALPSSVSDQFRYEFTLTGVGQTLTRILEPGEPEITLSIDLGEWTISAKAYTAEGVLAGEGVQTTIIDVGPNSVRIPMTVKDSFIAKAITAFSIPGPVEIAGIVDEDARTVTIAVPFGTDVTGLVPSITHTGASINPATGAAQDFTNPVVYTVTAADGTVQDYTVTVTIKGQGMITLTFTGPADENTTLVAVGITNNTISWLTDSLNVSIVPITGAAYQWYKDGVLIPGVVSNTYTAAGSAFTLGQHQLMLQVTASGVVYSKTLTFTVE